MSFSAAQQTSAAKLPAFFLKILKLSARLRVNVLRVFCAEQIKLFNSLLTKKKHVQKFDVRRQAKQELEEIGFDFNVSATRI